MDDKIQHNALDDSVLLKSEEASSEDEQSRLLKIILACVGGLLALSFTISFIVYFFNQPQTKEIDKNTTSVRKTVYYTTRYTDSPMRYEMTAESRLRYNLVTATASIFGLFIVALCAIYIRDLWQRKTPSKHLRELLQGALMAMIGAIFGFVGSGGFDERPVPVHYQYPEGESYRESGPTSGRPFEEHREMPAAQAPTPPPKV